MLNKNHRFFIITDLPFPNGFAGASRILSYAKGLNYHDYNATVICIRKTESSRDVLNKNANGIHDGVYYKYLSRSTVKSRYSLIKGLDNLLMASRLLYYSLFNINKNSTVIFYSVLTHAAILLRLASMLKGFNLLKEENEHPSVRVKVMNNIQAFFFYQFHYKLFDGMLVITNNLYKYFKYKNENKPILHIPILVDLERFNLDVEKSNTITYCGMLSDSKDGVNLLLKSFAEISTEFPEYKLILVGVPHSNQVLIQYKKMVNDLKINERVLFKGRLSNDKIPLEISRTKVLVLPRPDSVQAQNGFPTKLGEYLATGNPVVATSVGEIPNYLIDNKNAYIAIPGDKESLTKKLRESLVDSEKAIIIGQEGRKTAEKYFDNKKQTKRILSFISELHHSKELVKL